MPVANCPCCSCVESGCCDDCTDCSACSGGYDGDIHITSTSQSGSVSGSRSVIPCVSNCSTCTKVAPDGCVRIRCYNATTRDITVQFSFTVSGLSGSCVLNAQYNCGSAASYNNGTQAWFFFTIPPATSVSATLDHRVNGSGCCSDTDVTIGSFTYQTSAGGANPGCTDPEYYNDGGSGCVSEGDCTFYALNDVVTLACASCGSGFADHIVTLIECLGGGECRYTLDFDNCT